MSTMITIVGGGLAGMRSRLAGRVARRAGRRSTRCGRSEPTAVHKTDRLAELVCSNSFRGDKLDNAVGLLKEEMRRLGSLVMRAADATRVPAGAALAVDRDLFSSTRHRGDRVASADHASRARRSPRFPSGADGPVIVATGPLTSDALSADIAALVGAKHLYFYDAISPIVLAGVDRPDEGVPRVALGPEPAVGQAADGGSDQIDAEVRLRRRPSRPVPRAAWTTAKATI